MNIYAYRYVSGLSLTAVLEGRNVTNIVIHEYMDR